MNINDDNIKYNKKKQVLLKAFYIIVDTIGLFVKELPTLQPRADSVADMLIGGAFEVFILFSLYCDVPVIVI